MGWSDAEMNNLEIGDKRLDKRLKKTIEQMGEEILEYCIRAASGEVIPKAVQLNQDDFIPWKRGVSL